jgi:hypothetical protein
MKFCRAALVALTAIALCGCLYYDHRGWGWGIDVDNDRNYFCFDADDLSWEDWGASYTWRCDTDVAEVIFSSERDFDGQVDVRVYDDYDYCIFHGSYDGEGEIYDSDLTFAGYPGYWRVRIDLHDVSGSFQVRVLARMP